MSDTNDSGYYNRVASGYDAHRGPGGPFAQHLRDLAHEVDAKRVLEIGCGTGNSGLAFREIFAGELVCLDRSLGMIGEASKKGLDARFLNGSATELPLVNGSVQFVFGVLVLQHIADLKTCMAECFRVIDAGGCAFATAPTDFIDHYPLNPYFPSFAEIDRARFQHEDEVAETMERVGFECVDTTYFSRPPEPIDLRYVEKIANKFISTFALIPDDEFREGLALLRADVAHNGQLETPMEWKSVVISGRKR